MRVRRIKQVILDLLEDEGELTTNEIHYMVCKINHHGVTMNQLTNVLSRSPEIVKVGKVNLQRNNDRRRAIIWGLKN
jgi:hypothetical protein